MISLRPYQTESIQAIYDYFARGGEGHPLVVLPTGTGKSICIAEFVRRTVEESPHVKICMVTHVKELIEQNYNKLCEIWPFAPAGIVSAGLKRRDMHSQIIYAGIQTIHKYAAEIGKIDIILVDEAHMIPRNANTRYGQFLRDLEAINPNMRVIGFTATDYRLDSGRLTEGEDRLFTDVCYEASIADMIEQGYLSPVTTKATETALSTDGVHRRGGEFIASELEAAVNKDDLNDAITNEIIEKGKDRGSWLIFCAGVAHAENMAAYLKLKGINAKCLTGDTGSAERDETLRDFKAGKIQALTNVNVLTTGFDAPGTDIVALCRPTESTGLYVQMVGRGTRLANGKENCLILDFAGNARRHGPLDALNIGGDNRTKGEGDAPVKECPECAEIVYAGVKTCPRCGYEWEYVPDLSTKADAAPMLKSQIEKQRLTVSDVRYSIHKKAGKPDSLKVSYRCGRIEHHDWCCLFHNGYPGSKGRIWWMQRADRLPTDIGEALEMAQSFKAPSEIIVLPQGKYTEVVEVVF